jgi:hypothetical protein
MLMRKKYKFEIAALILGCAVVLVVAAPSFAQKKFLERIRKHYQLGPTNGKCTLCHEVKPQEDPGRKNLNKYGKAIQSDPDMKPLLGKDDEYKFTEKELEIFEKVIVKLEDQDSDGDGATNREELELGTNPGDATSVPDKAKLEKYRKDHPKKDAKDDTKK